MIQITSFANLLFAPRGSWIEPFSLKTKVLYRQEKLGSAKTQK
jgi:hypothetical protein